MRLVWIVSLCLAQAAVKGQPLEGGRLNSFASPFHLFFEGPDTSDINTYGKAKDFCRARGGRILAREDEWCRHRTNKDWTKRSPWNGQQDTEQWVPVRLWSNNYNNYLLIGPLGGTNHSAICRNYHEVYPSPPEPCVTNKGHEVFCIKPDDCTDDRCMYECPAGTPKGFYPDPTDCQSYCYCSGGDEPSWWETVAADGLIWDPWCRDSKSLVGNKKDPLSGMSGGCPNQDHYLEDKSYRTVESEAQRQLRIAPPKESIKPSVSSRHLVVEGGPSWGLSDDKPAFETNFILCTAWPSLPRLPKTCADIWGDPHIVTFDHLTYDVLGSGDYILSQSLTSGFRLQGRFKKSQSMRASTMTGFALTTGRSDDPPLEVFLGGHRDCHLYFMIDGEDIPVHWNYARNGTLSTGTEKIHFIHRAGYQFLLWKDTGISIKFRMKRSTAMGCYINAQFCIPDDIKGEQPVGILGSPDGDKSNDFMDPLGNNLEHKGKTDWKDAYDYATKNWCIREQAKSLFVTEPMTTHECDLPYDPTLENEVKSAPPELVAICGGSTDCLVEGTAGDVKDSTDSMVKVRELIEQRPELAEPDPETYKEPNAEEEDEIIENTTAEPADPMATVSPTTGSSSGDPHFKTFNGTKFDFHGECDLVLLSSPKFEEGLGLAVHLRTKIHKSSWWSYIEAASIQIGDDILEIMGGKDGGTFWVNKAEGGKLEDGEEFYLSNKYRVTFHSVNSHQRRFRISLGNENAVSIETLKSFVSVKASIKNQKDFEENVRGMMGSYPSGEMVGRDGRTRIDDPNRFGFEWQVLDSEPMLFHTAEGAVQHPHQCIMPSPLEASASRRRLGESLISQKDAELACARVDKEDRDACIFDVLSTNDIDMAGSY